MAERLTVRASVLAIQLAVALPLFAAHTGSRPAPRHPAALESAWLPTAAEAHSWVEVKNANLPTLTGSPEWRRYVEFLEGELRKAGVVDPLRNSWKFLRWDTSDTPLDWSLTSDGRPVRVANYGAYSGSTGPQGITAPLVFWDPDAPPQSVQGKIVVIASRPHPHPPFTDDYLVNYTFNDYEYATDPETLRPSFTPVDPSWSFTFDTWYQLGQRLYEKPASMGAAGVIVVHDMAFERASGMYTFLVPKLYNSPTLVLSREDGARVIADAKAGKTATLRLEATVETATAYQLITYLPGKDYGTPRDEQVVLVNHTDGPSISQDNGALGILGIVRYYAHIPREQRRRTLVIYLDCRHYMPGFEAAHKEVSWLNRFPEARKKIVGVVQLEHLGELDYREVDGRVEPTGLPEQSYLWVRNNPLLIDAAITAVKSHGWRRAQVVAPERPGIHGGRQELWWGVGVIASRSTPYGCDVWHCLDVPAVGLGGFLGNYYSIHSGIDRWDVRQFLAQTATMTELTGVLMTADLKKIRPK